MDRNIFHLTSLQLQIRCRRSPYHLKTIRLAVTETVDGLPMPEPSIIETDDERYADMPTCFASPDGRHHAVHTDHLGEETCEYCGLVVLEHEIVNKLSPQYRDHENTQDHRVAPRTYQRKQLLAKDLSKAARPQAFKRVMDRDGYYNAKERRDADTLLLLRRIGEVCHFNDVVVTTAFNHFRNLDRLHAFDNVNRMFYCTTLMQMALVEHGVHLQARSLVERVCGIEPVDVADVHDVTMRILKSGYNLKGHVMGLHETLLSLFRLIRESGDVPEPTLMQIQIHTVEYLEKHWDDVRYLGNAVSYLPAMIHLVSVQLAMPLTVDFVARFANLTPTTIRAKCRQIQKTFQS